MRAYPPGVVPRDLVIAALRFQQTDICPYYVWIHKDMLAPLARQYHVDDVRTLIRDSQVMREVTPLTQRLSATSYRDEFGAVWDDSAEIAIVRPALASPSLKGYTFPDLTTDAHFAGLSEWLDAHADRFRIVQLGMLFWERTWALRGLENILMDLHDAPSFVDELLDGLRDVCSAVIGRLLRDYGPRIDAIGFSEDMGTQRGMMFSPDTWRRFLKRHQKQMYDLIRSAGKTVYLHSCGDIQPIIGELIDMGVDMLQPVQPEAMDVVALKRDYGRNLCFAGGISTQRDAAVRDSRAGKGGGARAHRHHGPGRWLCRRARQADPARSTDRKRGGAD